MCCCCCCCCCCCYCCHIMRSFRDLFMRWSAQALHDSGGANSCIHTHTTGTGKLRNWLSFALLQLDPICQLQGCQTFQVWGEKRFSLDQITFYCTFSSTNLWDLISAKRNQLYIPSFFWGGEGGNRLATPDSLPAFPLSRV